MEEILHMKMPGEDKRFPVNNIRKNDREQNQKTIYYYEQARCVRDIHSLGMIYNTGILHNGIKNAIEFRGSAVTSTWQGPTILTRKNHHRYES